MIDNNFNEPESIAFPNPNNNTIMSVQWWNHNYLAIDTVTTTGENTGQKELIIYNVLTGKSQTYPGSDSAAPFGAEKTIGMTINPEDPAVFSLKMAGEEKMYKVKISIKGYNSHTLRINQPAFSCGLILFGVTDGAGFEGLYLVPWSQIVEAAFTDGTLEIENSLVDKGRDPVAIGNENH